MCAKMLLYSFYMIYVSISWIGVLAEEEVSSPLRVAQCRATCLQKVSFYFIGTNPKLSIQNI